MPEVSAGPVCRVVHAQLSSCCQWLCAQCWLARAPHPDACHATADIVHLHAMPPPGWVQTGGLCIYFSTPCCCRSAVLQETRRAGEHMISTDALQLLQWEVHGAALAALQQLGSSVTSSSLGGHATAAATDGEVGGITEKGVLQLLFDQRLLRDVLGGGKPLGAQAAADTAAAANGVADGSTASPAAALAARKKLVAGLEQRLQVGDGREQLFCWSIVAMRLTSPGVGAVQFHMLHAWK